MTYFESLIKITGKPHTILLFRKGNLIVLNQYLENLKYYVGNLCKLMKSEDKYNFSSVSFIT